MKIVKHKNTSEFMKDRQKNPGVSHHHIKFGCPNSYVDRLITDHFYSPIIHDLVSQDLTGIERYESDQSKDSCMVRRKPEPKTCSFGIRNEISRLVNFHSRFIIPYKI